MPVTTVSPTVTTIDVRQADPDVTGFPGLTDLNTPDDWRLVASFCHPETADLTYDPAVPDVDIAPAKIFRVDGDQRRAHLVSAVSGVSLSSGSTNYIFFDKNEDYVVETSDSPPDPESLLIGIIDDSTEDVFDGVGVRGRSPISAFQGGELGPDNQTAEITLIDAGTTTVSAGGSVTNSLPETDPAVGGGALLPVAAFGSAPGASSAVPVKWGPTDTANSEIGLSVDWSDADSEWQITITNGLSVGASVQWRVFRLIGPGVRDLAVTTDPADNISSDSADLNGTLVALGGAATADVNFEYGQTGNGFPNTTSKTELSSPQAFTDSISGLSDDTEYQYRALAAAADGDSAQGAIQTFTTAGLQLLYWWKLNEGSGSTATDSEGNNDGTINGATWTTDAKTGGQALDFDGSDDYVAFSNKSHTGEFSWTAWVKFDAPSDGNSDAVFFKSEDPYFTCRGQGDGTFYFYMIDNNGNFPSTSTSIPADTWVHLAGTWDTSTMTLYKDGSQVDTNSFTQGSRTADNEWVLGKGGSGKWLDGTADDGRFYGTALSGSEVQTIYNNTV